MQRIVIDNVELALKRLFSASIAHCYPQVGVVEAVVTPSKKFGDYQCVSAMAVAKAAAAAEAASADAAKPTAQQVGDALVQGLPANDLIARCETTAQGFINVFIRKEWASAAVKRVLERGIVPPEVAKEKVLVDFSSPNIAKEMHVGHLRSTIIGECLCRVFEFLGHDVERINHVGDWGTQFGMLILYLKTKFPNFLQQPPDIADLVEFYKESKKEFDTDPDFKERARLEVVKLQSYDAQSVKAWQMICDISRAEFQEIYTRLNVRLTERGESYYNEMLPGVIDKLTAAGLVEVNEGALIIISTKAVPINELTGKEMSKLMMYLVQVRKAGDCEFDPAFLRLLKEAGTVKSDEQGDEVVQLSKKEVKKFAAFDPSTDCDKLVTMVESLYKPVLHAALVDGLAHRGLIVRSTAAAGSVGADCAAAVPSVKVPLFNIPLMVRKSDGGFSYDSTDLAAMYHRFVMEKKDRVVYVTDVGQFEHFKMVAAAAEDAGWFQPQQRWQHAGFGLVTGEDGKKLKTRSGDTTKLKDLLDEACDRAYAQLVEREQGETSQGHTDERMRELSKIIGYGAVKYFDLKQNRLSDYAFAFDKVLDLSGNTAVYLLYSYARICSIKRKAQIDDVRSLVGSTDIAFDTEQEKNLALAALKLGPVLLKTSEDLMPKNLTDFAYELAVAFSDFFKACRVVDHPLQNSRLLLIEVAGITLKLALNLLGMDVAERL